MKFIKTIKKIALMAFAATAAMPVEAQDLLATQAPIDRKMKTVDSIALQHLLQVEEFESPASALYEDWDNIYAHKPTTLPDTSVAAPTPTREPKAPATFISGKVMAMPEIAMAPTP